MNPQPDILDEIGQMYTTELDNLPLSEISRMARQLTTIKDAATLYQGALQNALHNRLGEHAQSLRQAAGKETGKVSFEKDGFVVSADLPKRPEYDQHKLKEAVQALRKWGEDPENYVGIEIKVSEAKYSAWPPGIRQLFEHARTLKTGKPVYKLEQVTPPDSQVASNDSNFGEVA